MLVQIDEAGHDEMAGSLDDFVDTGRGRRLVHGTDSRDAVILERDKSRRPNLPPFVDRDDVAIANQRARHRPSSPTDPS